LMRKREILRVLGELRGRWVTVRWADAAEIRGIPGSKMRGERVPENLLTTIMSHSGELLGIQREPVSGKRYLILRLRGDGRTDVAAIPIDLVISVERGRKGRPPLKTSMLVEKYADGEVKRSGGVVKHADT